MTAYMATDQILAFVNRFKKIESQRISTEDLIKDLLIHTEAVERILQEENHRLAQEINNAQLDLEEEKRARRELAQQFKIISADNDNFKNRNPYILCLIDGDGLMFKEWLIRKGIEGGKRAAYDLRSAIVAECHKNAGDMEIMAKVYANVTGLSKAMKRDGSVGAESDLKDFALGFTQAKASFDFIDVGYGKERADSKIREVARWHLRNTNCKHILLGVSHDAGYAPFLDEILSDQNARNRVTVLEGVPAVQELRYTGVNIIDFDHLFRKDKLVNRMLESPASRSGSIGSNSGNTSGSPVAPVSSLVLGATSWAGITAATPPPPAPQITTPLAHINNNNNAQGRQGQSQNTLLNNNGNKTQQQQQPYLAGWNPGARGLDPPVECSSVALENIKKRKDGDKLCNNHYLRGPCVKGRDCCFEHRYRPTEEELEALAYLARQNPCTRGQDCDVENCIYGHHCPTIRDGVCVHAYCKFRVGEHPPNTKFRNIHIMHN